MSKHQNNAKDPEQILKTAAEEEKNITDVIVGLGNWFEKQDAEKTAGYTEKLVAYYEKLGNDDHYITEMNLIMHRLGDVPAKPWLLKHSYVERWDKFYVESIFNGLFSHWLYRYIQLNEDNSGGQADKERFITERLLKAIEDQTNLSLYAEYKDRPAQAYWSPKTLKDTDEVKEKFKSWWRIGEN